MAREIERKFLVIGQPWQNLTGQVYRQGYLSTQSLAAVRVRVIADKAYLTIKGQRVGFTRPEFEYEIPLVEANEMLDTLCLKPIIDKTRYKIEAFGNIWEVDVFFGNNEGLIVAEIELDHEHQHFEKPAWVGQEVTDDARYRNSSLVAHPYKNWIK